ncbi:hypothetical protein FHETE_3776 [Fusarium heterosporum]|uniref:Uncharacterized protein n=1 Tax=Fusarium heterosporum TaxID=42747 RepID=A0A8H5TLD1_FUSHE|nr:hypothetical protein FHETE_3776 [Fusarium heterosporum]
MPFDFKAYDQKCQGLTLEELQREWEHYTRLISGAATSTAVSGVAIPLTLGVSAIGVAMAAPAIHNARKKREIIERHLNRLNATHHTRKRDVLGSMAVSGTIGVVTMGVSSIGADAVATAGAEHGIQAIVANETAIKIVSHAAMDGAGMAVEHAHTGRLKKKDAHKAFQKAGVFQAVQDAKAAEAGYTAQPYPYANQAYQQYAAGSSTQALPNPPPPYSVSVEQPTQPAYNPTGYPQDSKTEVIQPANYQHTYHLTPNTTGQHTPQHTYGYLGQQQNPVSNAPSPMPSMHTPMFSPPQTPAMQYSPNIPQPYVQSQQSEIPHYSIATSPQPFDMSTLNNSLPAITPTTPYQQPAHSDSVLPTPPQDINQAYMPHPAQQEIPGQAQPAPGAGYFPTAPISVAPTGYSSPAIAVPVLPPQQIPAAQLPVPMNHTIPQHAVQQNTYRPTDSAVQPQYQQQNIYPSPQSTGTYPTVQASSTINSDRRGSYVDNSQPTYTHAPYNPQDYGPISQQGHAYNSPAQTINGAPAPVSQAVRPTTQYQMMPPTPLPTGSTLSSHQQDVKNSYFPASPPMEHLQNQQGLGQSWQTANPVYQTQYYPTGSRSPMHNPTSVAQ